MGSTSTGASKSFWDRVAAVPPRVWVALVLLVLAVSFVAQNRDTVRVRWLTFSVTSPLWAALLVMMLVGLLIGLLVRRWPPKRK